MYTKVNISMYCQYAVNNGDWNVGHYLKVYVEVLDGCKILDVSRKCRAANEFLSE